LDKKRIERVKERRKQDEKEDRREAKIQRRERG